MTNLAMIAEINFKTLTKQSVKTYFLPMITDVCKLLGKGATPEDIGFVHMRLSRKIKVKYMVRDYALTVHNLW